MSCSGWRRATVYDPSKAREDIKNCQHNWSGHSESGRQILLGESCCGSSWWWAWKFVEALNKLLYIRHSFGIPADEHFDLISSTRSWFCGFLAVDNKLGVWRDIAELVQGWKWNNYESTLKISNHLKSWYDGAAKHFSWFLCHQGLLTLSKPAARGCIASPCSELTVSLQIQTPNIVQNKAAHKDSSERQRIQTGGNMIMLVILIKWLISIVALSLFSFFCILSFVFCSFLFFLLFWDIVYMAISVTWCYTMHKMSQLLSTIFFSSHGMRAKL